MGGVAKAPVRSVVQYSDRGRGARGREQPGGRHAPHCAKRGGPGLEEG
jgi:hypothetical protein